MVYLLSEGTLFMEIIPKESLEKKERLQSIASFAYRSSLGTLLSRISGMLREQTTAFFFGTSPLFAAFLIAYRFALTLRRLLGESALLTGFIPKFEAVDVESKEKAASYFQEIHASLSGFLLLLLFGMEGILFGLWKTSFFSADNQEILVMMMLLLPSLFFICLYALCGALLQCKKRFFLSAVAPAVFNLSWIIAIFWIGKSRSESLVLGLTVSTVVAFVLQWLFLVPSTFGFFREFFRWKDFFRLRIASSELWSLLKSISVTAIGLGAVQINGFLDILFARGASLEGPAYLYYAMRLHQLPLALIGVAISSALLPSLSRAFKENDQIHFQELLSFGLKRAFTLIVPSTFAIFALGLSSVILIYYRGCFHEGSVVHTTLSLWGFSLGLLPMTLSLLLSQGFYARQDYRTPTIASLVCVFLNVLLNVFFIWILKNGPESVTLSTSFASCVNVWMLYRKLNGRVGNLLERSTLWVFLKILISGLGAALATLFVGDIVGIDHSLKLLFNPSAAYGFPTSLGGQILQFFMLLLLFSVLFFSLAAVLRVSEIFQMLRWKRRKASPIPEKDS